MPQTCDPLEGAAPEVCDGLDNDCDGSLTDDGVDEVWHNNPTSCGVGVCASTGVLTCQAGAQIDTCAAGTPTGADDDCNGVDEDCSGVADDNYVATPTACGDGACAGTGTLECVAGSLQDTCTAGDPTGVDDECNGVDEDCSGVADDNYVPTVTSCGVGACEAAGQMICVEGNLQDTCVEGDPTGADDDCNGIDDDCDGEVDNNYEPTPTTCGIDLCYDEGALDCIDGQIVDTCVENPPTTVYYDGDSDGYGHTDMTLEVCTLPTGYVFIDGDCNDNNSTINPGAFDICDMQHNVINKDCNSSNDSALDCNNFCGDIDFDSYVTDEKWDNWGGVIPDMVCPWVVDRGDCNDSDAAINPVAEEICDGVDNNCDGKMDEGCSAVDKEDALAILESLSSSDPHSQEKLDKAIQELKKSLGNRHPEGDKKIVWLDTVHLVCKHGNKAFDKEKKAVDNLEKITDPSIASNVNEAISLIVHADRLLAETAIAEAPDGHDKDKAIEEYNKAQTETENKKKIDKYKKAWKHINKHCKEDRKKSCIDEITVMSPAGDTVTAVGDAVGHPITVFTDIDGSQIAIHTSCSRCVYVGQMIDGWTITDIAEDGRLADKCAE